MRNLSCLFLFSVLLLACGPSLPEAEQAAYDTLPEAVDYSIHVRPILSDRCWSCHGPDEAGRMAELRLDNATDAYAKAIVPGKRSSELVRRILSDDPDYRMPTPESHLSLTPREKAILVKWIEDGAAYQDHWAFTPLPSVAEAEQLQPARIDALVRAKYAARGLTPNGPADARTLVRRVYRDLTGLPPTAAQTRAFVADPSETAYLALVDTLLQSDAAAERLTQEWLDVARYADSHGMHADGIRTAWPYRDWVLRAWKNDMPYDRFVTEQLAGDLIEGATQDQILATAFNRNHPMTAEGGAIDEEFRMNYVIDRTNTFSTAFLGLTLECAQCHDHKFDPVSQREYFELTAFFNNVKEVGMTGDDGDYGPLLALVDPETAEKLADLNHRIEALETPREGLARQINFIERLPDVPRPIAYLPFDAIRGTKTDGYPASEISDTLYTVRGAKGKAYHLDTEWDMVQVPVGNFESYDPFSASIWVKPTRRDSTKWQTVLANTGHKNAFWRGWEFALDPQGHLNLRLIHSYPGNYIEVTSTRPVAENEWTQIGFTYDGSSRADGVQLYLDARPTQTRAVFDRLNKSIHPITEDGFHRRAERPLRVGKAGRQFTGENGLYFGAVDELYLFDTELSALEMSRLALAPVTPRPVWNRQHAQVLTERKLQPDLRRLRKARLALMTPVEEIMVMQEMPTPRPAYRLERGNYDSPAERVAYGTPTSVLPFDNSRYADNRLGLAAWLFSEDNPLAARVAANRYWQLLMGTGIVKTSHDFGMQGALPTHPELLDYLANGLRAADWDIKALLRAIVLSETYRMSSRIDPAEAELDPENRYYARAATYRYPAEFIRDYALKTSGLLVEKLGGPSVRPYQPKGLWIEKGSFSKTLLNYVPQRGDSLYRRSLYTFIRRTSPPPAMSTLDMPSRDRCTVSRERTNTPLQALVLLNDPQFVEAARVLAQSVAEEENQGEAAVEAAVLRTLGRAPTTAEQASLSKLYGTARETFAAAPAQADELLAVGEYPLPTHLDRAHVAALTVVTNTLLNHDEVYMRR